MKKPIIFLLTGVFFSLSVSAEELTDISISGTARIENATILNYLRLKEGDDVSASDLDTATKTLFATGLFSDVQVKMNKGRMTITVVENPIVHTVYFEGNKKLDDDVLKTEVRLKSRSVYTQSLAQGDADRLLELYKRSGRFGATVTPKIIQKDQNRVDVVFEIDEGEKTVVKKINFIGNKRFSASDLKDALMTKESVWYRFFATTDTYDPDRLNYDKELLRRFYLQKGYVDFEVKSAVAELMPDKEGFIITIEVFEGEKYRFAQPEIKVSLPEYHDQAQTKLQKLITFKKNDLFNVDQIDESIEILSNEFADEGYAFVEIIPEFIKNDQDRTVQIIFRVQEGEKVFINQINIFGNDRTKDKVIRREFRIKEGDPFNAAKLRRSKQRVEDLDYFERVDFKTVPISDDSGRTNIDVSVAEKSTGAFNIGVGWSSYDGLLFETGIVERNVLGTGNTVNLNALISQKETQYLIGLTDPYFMDKDLLAGVDIFRNTRDNEDSSSYNYTTVGATGRLGWNYTEAFRQSVRYTLRQDDVHDVDEDASIYIKDQEGKTVVSLIGQEISYDKRDSRINPTEGYYLSLGTDIAGLGGDTKFFRVNVMGIQYFSVAEEVVLSLRGDGGRIWGLDGQDVRVNNRYFLGDMSLRGFEYGGVGARDRYTGDALGGNWYVTASAELTFPLGIPREFGIKGKVFTDAGYIGKPDEFNADIIEYSSSIRAAVGTGILWQSPMGLINLDFAFPILKEKEDETQVFRLNFGKAF